ncbi:hypothetical protein LEP1GSC047_0184 [Leptospira inadai serovar Lyme str. 10]|uniref:Uncharacterized protein n=1 Tax=Leptospira inadai serovar Lyme str. 10 TaxID=1049790 RepID=V6HF81_9LEPT|nr:hypothetical protein LEP1GSC047_0184 [Leptospira inadai serovar Lyme str. 10]
MYTRNETCSLCENRKNKTIFVENGIPIVRCLVCNHVYSTYKQEEHFEKYWDVGEIEYDLNW